MRPNNTSALALAGRLRDLDDLALAELIRARQVRDAGIKDFFDLADRLLEPSTIATALSQLDRSSLKALSTHSPVTTGAEIDERSMAVLHDLALVDTGHVPYAEVTAVLRDLPGAEDLSAAPPTAPEVVGTTEREAIDRTAAERAFACTLAVLDVLAELDRGSARELAKGGIALPDAKRLAAATSLNRDEIPSLMAIAASAGVIELVESRWQVAAASAEWQQRSAVERWLHLAQAWIAALPGDIHDLLVERADSAWGENLLDFVRWLYPASSGGVRESMATQFDRADRLGITADSVPSTAGSLLLAGDTTAATAAITPAFPIQIDTVYLQHDLTIVAPGPLAAPLDSRLRELADVESRGLATTYRVSAGSLQRAIATGDTADSIRDFLGSISLTPIPQPLDYLVEETARRHGLVRVSAGDRGAVIRSADAHLLDTVRVDHNLYSLALRAVDADTLESRLDSTAVFWALRDARYPVVAEDASGAVVMLERRTDDRAQVKPVRDTAIELVARLRTAAAETSGTGAAWLERQLELAIKARTSILVLVRMPSGVEVEYLIDPTGLGGGRLRAKDRAADIERTIPLINIIEVRSVD